MNVGYVRLSRDDDKHNYVSIENQKLIITQFAAENHFTIDRWYEDDGVSGYKFDRPGFNQLMADLDKDIDRVFVKDFSRLGRHNAKVLLLLDEFQERSKHLIVIDDHYDSMQTNDDTIGIKTWYNEKYVKDTSQKIKRALNARQKEGTLITQPPFGYIRSKKDKSQIEIVPKEAKYIKVIYDLYLQGFGYRKIANHLTQNKIPTPSMIRHAHEIKEGKITKYPVTAQWSDAMVRDILGNDFYIGTLRLRKRARCTVHGKDKRVPQNEQYVFKNHHPAIIDIASFDLIQDIKKKRTKSKYRGSRKQYVHPKTSSPFGCCLFCKDCGSRLTPIRRITSGAERKYYICTTYNTKGRLYCPKAHLIEENNLMKDLFTYIKFCRNFFCEDIAAYSMEDFNCGKKAAPEKRTELQNLIEQLKRQLKILFTQKIRDLSTAHGNEDVIHESYEAMQQDILAQINFLKAQLEKLNVSPSKNNHNDTKEEFQNALQIIDLIIEKGTLDRKDIEILIEKIEVDKDGLPEIEFRYGLSHLIQYSPAQELNRHQNEIIYQMMHLILEGKRDYISARYLSKLFTNIYFPISEKNVLPYIGLMIDMGIIAPGDSSRKPYTIRKAHSEIQEIMTKFHQDLPHDTSHSL
ncbi:recombinase family protein [Parablautia muri]|uniref:Recombinase n=1 Tax=Parablautia muri TaxID=2320879 RepID=A0A9X5BH23_9FIRM|nr:recombinase family protein [Parablautia muri]NBJ93915.1 hypothetical protein [Parablautia muri]